MELQNSVSFSYLTVLPFCQSGGFINTQDKSAGHVCILGSRRSEEENSSSPDGKIRHLRNKSSTGDFDSKIKIEVIKGELAKQKVFLKSI